MCAHLPSLGGDLASELSLRRASGWRGAADGRDISARHTSAQVERSSDCLRKGCSSTWLTAGKTLACAFMSANFFADQLDTPILLALPAACSASMAVPVVSEWLAFQSLLEM